MTKLLPSRYVKLRLTVLRHITSRTAPLAVRLIWWINRLSPSLGIYVSRKLFLWAQREGETWSPGASVLRLNHAERIEDLFDYIISKPRALTPGESRRESWCGIISRASNAATTWTTIALCIPQYYIRYF